MSSTIKIKNQSFTKNKSTTNIQLSTYIKNQSKITNKIGTLNKIKIKNKNISELNTKQSSQDKIRFSTKIEMQTNAKLKSVSKILNYKSLKSLNQSTTNMKEKILDQKNFLVKKNQKKDKILKMTKYFQNNYLKLGKPSDNFEKILSDYNNMRFKQDEPSETDGESAEQTAEPDAAGLEAKQKVNPSATFVPGDWPLVLSPTPTDPGLVAADNDDAVNKSMDLNSIPKPKKLDTLFTPDIFDLGLKNQLYPDEFYGVQGISIQEWKDKKLSAINPDLATGENYLMYSNKQIELRAGDQISIQDIDKITTSCTTLDAPSICTVEQFLKKDEDFKTSAETAGVSTTDPTFAIMETDSHYGNAVYVFKFADLETAEYFRAICLFNLVKNSQTVKTFQREEGGEICVDQNSGQITEKYHSPEGDQISTEININSLTSYTWDQSKSEVKVVQREIPIGATEFVETSHLLKLIKEPQGVKRISDHEFWQAQNLHKHIDSATNLQYYYQIEQKKEIFLTGIQDLQANQNSKPPKLLQSYKFPLKLMKMVENQMNQELSCLQKASIIVYLAELYSAQNVYITMELLQFQYVLDIFPSVNPTQDGVEQQNWFKLFRTQAQTEDGHGDIYLKHPGITLGVAHRFLYQINEKKCKSNVPIALEDQIDLYTNFSPKHFEWATFPKWEPQRDEISSFVPYNKKPDMDKLCETVKTQKLRSVLLKHLAMHDPFANLLKMVEKFPMTAIYVFDELTHNIGVQGQSGMTLLSDGLQTTYPDANLPNGIEGMFALADLFKNNSDQSRVFKTKDAEVIDANFKTYIAGAGKLVQNIRNLGGSVDAEINNEVAIKIIDTFKDEFTALNQLMFAANPEMGGAELSEINSIVSSPADTKTYLQDGDCKEFQDKQGMKDFCAVFEGVKAEECEVSDLKSLVKAPVQTDESVEVVAVGVESPAAAESVCDPEIATAIGNLEETALRDSIKNTQMQAVEDPGKQCELPKIYLLELLMTGGLTEDQAKAVMSKIKAGASSFLQNNSSNHANIKNLNKNQIKKITMNTTKIMNMKMQTNQKKTEAKSEFLKKTKEFCLTPGSCDGSVLKRELSIVVDSLNYEKLKNGLCGAMSHEAWQAGFAKSNAALAETLQGSLEKPWWPLIPPSEWVKDNTSAVREQLSCNLNCLRALVESMKDAGALDAPVLLGNVSSNLAALESVDFKSEFDVQVEAIVAKEGEPLSVFNELINLPKMSPQLLQTLLEYISSSESAVVGQNLTTALKKDEQCTYTLDDFIKLKSLNKPAGKTAPMINKVVEENLMKPEIEKYILNKLQSCEGVGVHDIQDIMNGVKNIASEPDDVKELIGRENLPENEKFRMATVSQEQDMTLSAEVAQIITAKITGLDAEKATCLWNNVISCRCFLDALKESDPSVLTDLQPLSSEEKALTADAVVTDSDKRQMLISCMEGTDTILATVGTESAECSIQSERPFDATFEALVASLGGALDADAKTVLDNLLSGSETIPEKVKILMSSEFASNAEAVKAMKAVLADHISDEDIQSTDDVECVYEASLKDPNMVKCANENLAEDIACGSDPDSCMFVLDKDCEKVMLESACTKDALKKLSSISASDNGEASTVDPKLTINEEDCIYDGNKVISYKEIKEKSEQKMKIFDLKMKIEDCNLKKLEDEAQEAKEEDNALGASGTELAEVAGGDAVAGGDSDDSGDRDENAQESENLANLTSDMANEMNAIVSEILKEKVNKVGDMILRKFGSAVESKESEGSNGSGSDGEYKDENMEFDSTVEKDNFLKTPDNMARSEGITPEVSQQIFRLKQACDINFALVFDEYLSKCIKTQKCNKDTIKGFKIDQLNIINALDNEDMKIIPGDTDSIIRFKLQKLEEFVKPQTARDNLGGIEESIIDMTHENLNAICSKLGIETRCQAGPASARFRFADKKFLPEEVSEPDATDLKTMVVVAQLYNDTVAGKPVYTIALHNKIRKAETNSLALPQNIVEGVDADFVLNNQREKGLVYLALANKLKTEQVNAIAQAIPKMDVQPSEVKPIVDDLTKEMLKVQGQLLSLPNIFSSLQVYNNPGSDPKQPALADLEKAFESYLDLKKGVEPQSDFFMMKKIATTESKGLDKEPKQDKLLQAVFTVHRFKASGLVFRSLDLVKGIQKSLKGDDQSKNYLKQNLQINFMTKGEVFLEYITMRQENRVKKNEQKKAESKKEEGG